MAYAGFSDKLKTEAPLRGAALGIKSIVPTDRTTQRMRGFMSDAMLPHRIRRLKLGIAFHELFDHAHT
jgi:hypothetical protein